MRTIIILIMILAGDLAFAQSSIEDGRYVNIYSGITSLSSSLGGSGFNSNLPGKPGLLVGGDVSYQFKDTSTRLNFMVDHGTNTLSTPSGLSPSEVTMSKTEYTLLGSFAPSDSGAWSKLRLGVGYTLLMQGSSDTSPNDVATMQTTQGLRLQASYAFKPKDSLVITPNLGLYLPYQISEKSQVTGDNPRFYGAELRVDVDYFISDSFSIYAGIGYDVYEAKFDDTGTRGVSGATDTRSDWSIPVGIKLGY